MHDEDFFWEGVNNNQLLFQQCSECNTLRQPPGPMCPQCQSLTWQPHAAKGTGTVYAWIVSKHPNQHSNEQRVVVLVELSEGIRLVSNLQDFPADQVHEGLPVEVFFQEINGQKLPQFRPARAGV
jgi:uncharacterized OB-fold protein